MLRSIASASVLLLCGCTASSGGEALWTKACARALEGVDEPGPEAQLECVESMRGHPRAIADDMARCMLLSPQGADPEAARVSFDACVRAETHEHLAKQVAADTVLAEIAEELGRRRAHGSLPERLAVIEGEQVVGPWGHPVVYVRRDDENFELSIVGPDGVEGTADDIRWEPQPFIYFQF